MEKTTPSILKRSNYKHSRSSRKKQAPLPLKVVYITNPIRFETSAAEFRSLVQELTGQDAAYAPDSSGFPVSVYGGAAREKSNVDHAVDSKVWRGSERRSETLAVGSYVEDEFYAEILDSELLRDSML